MVTAETAVVLPVLVFLTLVAVTAIAVAQARVRCADAAQLAAREVARGDTSSAESLARHAASGVRITTSVTASDTTVTARLPLRPVSWLGSVTIVETATVATEPSMAP